MGYLIEGDENLFWRNELPSFKGFPQKNTSELTNKKHVEKKAPSFRISRNKYSRISPA